MKKRMIALFLLVFTLGSTAALCEPAITLCDNAASIPEAAVTAIAERHNGAAFITVHTWVPAYVKSAEEEETPAKAANPSMRFTNEDVMGDSIFITSVAKRVTLTLNEAIECRFSPSVTGAATLRMLGIDRHITITLTKDEPYTGPEEASPCNSREYRGAFFFSEGEYLWNTTDSQGLPIQEEGTFIMPEGYVVYSLDTLIE